MEVLGNGMEPLGLFLHALPSTSLYPFFFLLEIVAISLEGLMLKLKLQYFGHLKGRTDSLEKTPVLGKIEGKRRRGQQKMR